MKLNCGRGNKILRNDHSSDIIFERKKDIMAKWTLKPCNNDFKILSDEAKKNASVRYYFENNFSHW
jgi:hypothetical protein